MSSAPKEEPTTGRRALLFSLVALAVLGGLGLGGYFLWRSDKSPPIDNSSDPPPKVEKLPPPKV